MSSPSPARILRAVTFGHFGIDVFNSMGPVLLAFLKTPLGLSAGQVGLAVGLHQFLAGSTQPPFGWLVDRIGSRFLGPGSVLWTMGCLCLALYAASRSGFGAFLVFFAGAALGSGAFHPQGAMHAATALPGRAATTTSIFFLFGQIGLATGPPLAGFVLDRFGVGGIYWLALALSPIPVFMAVSMGSARANPAPHETASSGVVQRAAAEGPMGPWEPRSVALLAAIFSLRAWVFIGTAAFLPLLFQQKGWSSGRQGLVAGCFWMGGAIGGVLVGNLADRWGRRRSVGVASLAGALVLPVLPVSEGSLAFLLALVCGAFLGAPHSILMVIAQDLLPVRRGLSSGLALGFLFAMGAVSSWMIGLLADQYPLDRVLQTGGVLAFLVALLSILLPASSSPVKPSPATIEAVDRGAA